MKIKIVNEGNILVEGTVSSLNIDDTGVEFYMNQLFWMTTQGHGPEDRETGLWLQGFVDSEDLSQAISSEYFNLADIQIYLKLDNYWEIIPLKDSFEEDMIIKNAILDSIEWFDLILGYSSTEEAIVSLFKDEGYTLNLYTKLKSSLKDSKEAKLEASEGMAIWFEETGVEINGFKTLEEALLEIYPDEGATLDLYNRLKNISKNPIEPLYKEITTLVTL